MDFQIVWSDPALADLREIVDRIALSDPSAAGRVGGEIIEHVETLQSFPFIGPAYPRGTRGDRREIVCGSYRIFYSVKQRPKQVEVLAIRHGAREEPTL